MKTHKQKKPHSFFSLLVRNYLVFTLVLVLVAISIFSLASLRLERVLREPSIEDIRAYSDQLSSGQFGRIPVKKLLGKTGVIEVLDSDGTLVYSSGLSTRTSYTSGELACIFRASQDNYRDVSRYDSDVLHSKTIVVTYTEASDDSSGSDLLVIDENRRVVSGTSPTGNPQLTESEYGFLTNNSFSSRSVQQLPFQIESGEDGTLLLHCSNPSEQEIQSALNALDYAVYVFLGFYLLIVAFFIFSMNRRIKRPMQQLNRAILDFGEGRPAQSLSSGPSELLQISESFSALSQRLSESEQQRCRLESGRQQILADISHDLKTPITVIQGYSKAICDGLIPEEKKEQYLMTIYQKSNLLTDLINTFYEYSKLDHPDFRIAAQRLDLCEVAREYLAAKYSEIDLAGFLLEIEIPETPVTCAIDPLALRRVFENIIVNTLKHNPAGTTVFFTLVPREQDVLLTIADNGRGISPEIRADLFEPFIVGDDSRNNKQGSGLGLAISKKIIEAHGGSIQLIEPPAAGLVTEFSILLPKI